MAGGLLLLLRPRPYDWHEVRATCDQKVFIVKDSAGNGTPHSDVWF